MEIIPVLDLKDGAVVHARHGQRNSYQPIVSPLSSTSAADDVLAGVLRLYAFRTIYIADLNAIQKKDEHSRLIAELASAHPAIGFWVDNGSAEPIRCANIRHVLGSESIRPSERVEAVDSAAILSLDFRGADFLGPRALLEQPALWPSHVIVMTLARIGSTDGPDVERLASIKRRAGTRRVYAAGGVRGRDDLDMLRDAGAAGVLVASALHDGRLTPADLVAFS